MLLASCLVACGGSGTTADGGIDGMTSDALRLDAPAADAPTPDAPLGDSGCTTDSDGDGHRAITCGGDDCDDADANRFPGNPERCDTTGHDEDCNPMTLGPDGDHDGFVSTDCCNTQPGGALACGQDCDDARATVNPSAVESCNAIDDDCNGAIDDHDVQLTFFHDVDSDGYGDSAMPMTACVAPFGYVLTGGDCDDTRPSSHPGATDGPTANCDGRDNDCDGTPDRGCPCIDGATQMCGATDASGMLITTTPCHPGMQTCTGATWGMCVGSVVPMPETCNSIDDDCDGAIDDGARVPCYLDADHDTYAPSGATMSMECADSAGHCPTGFTGTAPATGSATDCNDAQATVHPGAIENCNMIDDNCNGIVDDGAGVDQWRDADGDGYGGAMDTACVLMTGYVTVSGDCDDSNPAIHPGAPEACDGIDSNCAGGDDSSDPAASDWCLALPHVRPIPYRTGLCHAYPGDCPSLDATRYGCGPTVDCFGSRSGYACDTGWAEGDIHQYSCVVGCFATPAYVVGADGCETPS